MDYVDSYILAREIFLISMIVKGFYCFEKQDMLIL